MSTPENQQANEPATAPESAPFVGDGEQSRAVLLWLSAARKFCEDSLTKWRELRDSAVKKRRKHEVASCEAHIRAMTALLEKVESAEDEARAGEREQSSGPSNLEPSPTNAESSDRAGGASK